MVQLFQEANFYQLHGTNSVVVLIFHRLTICYFKIAGYLGFL